MKAKLLKKIRKNFIIKHWIICNHNANHPKVEFINEWHFEKRYCPNVLFPLYKNDTNLKACILWAIDILNKSL